MKIHYLIGFLIISFLLLASMNYTILKGYYGEDYETALTDPENTSAHSDSEIKTTPIFRNNDTANEMIKTTPIFRNHDTANEMIRAIKAHNDSAIAVLVLACNRVTVVRCIDQLLLFRPSVQQFPIIVSQDGEHKDTANAIRAYGDQILYMRHLNQTAIPLPTNTSGYIKIARHYRWALNQIFFSFNFTTGIIIEDDLDISPDLFEYFLGTLPIMEADPTLWCVSAWNDNGKLGLIQQDAPHLLHRTDFFPGLGWMLTKATWAELVPKWPASTWDEYMRNPEQRKGRACIRPEISRTRTFGKTGVSNGQYYEQHLKYIYLNEEFVPFTKVDLDYLLKDNYDFQFFNTVNESKVTSYHQLISNTTGTNGSVRILYNTQIKYKRIADKFGLMNDLKFNVARTGYKGVVSFLYNNRRVYLTPSTANYNIT